MYVKKRVENTHRKAVLFGRRYRCFPHTTYLQDEHLAGGQQEEAEDDVVVGPSPLVLRDTLRRPRPSIDRSASRDSETMAEDQTRRYARPETPWPNPEHSNRAC